MRAEVRGCAVDAEGNAVWVSTEKAEYFSVYLGTPGEIGWLADFAHYSDAYSWAEEVAIVHNCKFEDLTYTEH